MDCQRGTSYEPLSEPRVGLELTHVKTPTDVVAFATRFGLLGSTRDMTGILRPEDLIAQAREPVATFLAAAADLRWIVKTAIDVRRGTQGDASAIARLREDFRRTDDRSVLLGASTWVAWGLSNGVIDARPHIYDRAQMGEPVAPGLLRVGILPETLVETCYLTIALLLADKEPLERCSECQRLFIVEDARQKFCTPVCANRARFKRFDRKRKEAAKKKER